MRSPETTQSQPSRGPLSASSAAGAESSSGRSGPSLGGSERHDGAGGPGTAVLATVAVASKGLDTRKQPYKRRPGVTGRGRIAVFRLDETRGRRDLESARLCGKRAVIWEHKPCGARGPVIDSCNRRVCTKCSRRRAAHVQRRYARDVAAFRHPALVTLTVPNARSPESLEAALGLLLGGFRELRRRRVWPKGTRGLWSLEVTWSAEHGYHPHLHVVCDLPWVDFEDLSAEWERLTGARHRPDVKRAITDRSRAGLLREGIKYVAKPWELPGEALLAVASALAGRRMVQPFGGVRAHDEDPGRLLCPCCEEPYDPHLFEEDWFRTWVNSEDLQAFATGPRWVDWSAMGWKHRPG